jgi:hypothetical protein
VSVRTAKGSVSAPTYGFKDDTDTGFHSSAANTLNVVAGGAEIGEWSASALPSMTVVVDLTAGDGVGVVSGTANPFGYNVVITNLTLVVSTASTGACTVDIGVGASDTSNDGLIDGLSVAATGAFSSAVSGGTNGKGAQSWSTTTYLNVAEASGDITGFVGKLYATCVKA